MAKQRSRRTGRKGTAKAQDAAAPEAAPQPARRPRWRQTHSLLIVVFLCGAVLMALEMVGSRILAPTFGNTVFVWGSLIGVFLGALSLGYLVGGWLADRTPSFFVLGMIIAGAGVIILVVPLYAPACCRWVDGLKPGRSINPLFASVLLFFVPSVLLGMVSPFSVRLQARTVATVGNVAGRLYALSTLGSIAGTLIATFWMIPSFGTPVLAKALGVALIAASLLAIVPRLVAQLASRRFGGSVATSLVVGLAVLLTVVHSPTFIPLDAGEFLIAERDSPYQHIGIVLRPPKPRLGQPGWSIRMMFDKYIESEILVEPCKPDDPGAIAIEVLQRGASRKGDTDASADEPPKAPSHIRITDPYTSGAKYTDMLHLPFLFFKAQDYTPRNCLIVGGGGGVVPTVFRKAYPDLEIDVVEIDPVVLEMAKRFFAFKTGEDDEKTTTTIMDGRVFLRETDKTYDLIILDAFTGGRPPFHLMTREFLQLVKSRLTPEKGVAHLNIISALDGPKGRFYRAVDRTFRDVDVFGPEQVYVFPKWFDSDSGYSGEWHFVDRYNRHGQYDRRVVEARKREDGMNIQFIATNFGRDSERGRRALSARQIVRIAKQDFDATEAAKKFLAVDRRWAPSQNVRHRGLDGAPLREEDQFSLPDYWAGTDINSSIPIHALHHAELRKKEEGRDLTADPILTDDFAPVDMMVIE